MMIDANFPLCRRELINAAGLFALGTPGSARASDLFDLNEILEPLRVKNHLPALGGGILTLDGLSAFGVTGVRKHGDPTPVQRDDLFHLGSCTKAMTAALIGRVVEQGRIRWSTTLSEALPDLPKTARDQFADVTVLHLLAHRSGLPGGSAPPGKSFLDIHRLPGAPREQRARYLAEMFSQKPTAGPGELYEYSNVGYAALGAMAEQAAGKPWETLIAKELFHPLGIKLFGFGAMGEPGKVRQPFQHRLDGGSPVPIPPGPLADNPPAMAPAGRVHCSLKDWSLFLVDQLRGMAGRNALLKQATYEALKTPRFGGEYAGGWIVVDRSWGGGTVYNHAGSNTMNYAVAWLAPAKGFGVFAATNAGGNGVDEACDAISMALVRHYRKAAGA